jgi:hypothetical protein
VAIDTTAALIAAVKAKHTTIVTAAKSVKTLLEANTKTIEGISESRQKLLPLPPLAMAKASKQLRAALITAWKLRITLKTQLKSIRVQYDAVVAEARKLQIEEIITEVETNTGIFRVN